MPPYAFIKKLDWESIRSSPRDGSRTSYRLTKGLVGFDGQVGGCGGLGGWPPRFPFFPGILIGQPCWA